MIGGTIYMTSSKKGYRLINVIKGTLIIEANNIIHKKSISNQPVLMYKYLDLVGGIIKEAQVFNVDRY